jgi:PAS domain S-box-containing protein
MKYTLFLLIFLSIFFNLNAKELKKVSLQLQWKHQFEFAGFYIAKEKGYYKDAGLDVEIKEFDFGIDVVSDVALGKTTFGTNYPTVILKKSQGKEVVLLSAILQTSPHALISLESSNIKSIKDFKNKTMMIDSTSANTAPFISMLQSKNISFENINTVPQTFNINNLIDGKVDITTTFISNEPFILKKKGIKYKIWDPRDYGFDFYDVLLFTSSKQTKQDPKMVSAFNQATIKGWEYAFKNIEEACELILKKYNTQNKSKDALKYEANILKELAYFQTNKLGKIDPNKIQRIIDIYNILGMTKKPIELNSFIFNSANSLNSFTEEEKKYLAKNNIIKYCCDPNWMPYEGIKDGEHIGVSAEYLKLFEDKLNIKFELVQTKSWNESKQKGKARECDIFPLSSDTTKRRSYMNITKPYIVDPLVLATNIDKNFITNFSNLNGKTIAITKGYSIVKKIQDKYPKIKVIETNGIQESLKLVKDQKIFGCIDATTIVNYHINKLYPNQLKISSKLDENYNLGIASNKDKPILNDIMTKVINSITKEERNTIFNKWNKDLIVVEKVDYTILSYFILVTSLIILFLLWRHKTLTKYNDVLEEKNEQIINQKEKYKTLLDLASDGIHILDKKGNLLQCSKSFAHNLGYSYEEALKLNVKDWDDQIDVGTLEELINKLMENPKIFEKKHRKKDGTILDVQINARGVIIDGKKYLYASQRDITDIKQKDITIFEQSKMVALGEMIGNIAHQWRQPLSIISTTASGIDIKREFGELNDNYLDESIITINRNVQYLSSTIDTFKNFIKGDKVLKYEPVQDEILQGKEIISSTLKNNFIELIDNIDYKNKISIYMSIGELSQVIMNILNNAKDILVEKDIDEPWIKLDLHQLENKITITIEDNAGGIPIDILPHIFEPYFTTKHQSQGTGLGLHMSFRIVTESLKGKLWATNTNNGAKFYIEIPLNDTE